MNCAASLAVLAVLNVTSAVASPEAVSSTWAQHVPEGSPAPVPQLTPKVPWAGCGSAPETRRGGGASAVQSLVRRRRGGVARRERGAGYLGGAEGEEGGGRKNGGGCRRVEG
jgi:hypothetical protein